MNYYAMQVKTRSENKYLKLFHKNNPDVALPLYFPQKQMYIKIRGRFINALSAVFPGYIFIEAEDDEEIIEYRHCFRETEGFYRFLISNKEITPLTDKNLDLVLHFIKKVGSVAGRSKVYFDESSRIVVLEGPLKGLEGRIIKVDKRKCRAKISLDLYNDAFTIDLSFEVIEAVKKAK